MNMIMEEAVDLTSVCKRYLKSEEGTSDMLTQEGLALLIPMNSESRTATLATLLGHYYPVKLCAQGDNQAEDIWTSKFHPLITRSLKEIGQRISVCKERVLYHCKAVYILRLKMNYGQIVGLLYNDHQRIMDSIGVPSIYRDNILYAASDILHSNKTNTPLQEYRYTKAYLSAVNRLKEIIPEKTGVMYLHKYLSEIDELMRFIKEGISSTVNSTLLFGYIAMYVIPVIYVAKTLVNVGEEEETSIANTLAALFKPNYTPTLAISELTGNESIDELSGLLDIAFDKFEKNEQKIYQIESVLATPGDTTQAIIGLQSLNIGLVPDVGLESLRGLIEGARGVNAGLLAKIVGLMILFLTAVYFFFKNTFGVGGGSASSGGSSGSSATVDKIIKDIKESEKRHNDAIDKLKGKLSIDELNIYEKLDTITENIENSIPTVDDAKVGKEPNNNNETELKKNNPLMGLFDKTAYVLGKAKDKVTAKDIKKAVEKTVEEYINVDNEKAELKEKYENIFANRKIVEFIIEQKDGYTPSSALSSARAVMSVATEQLVILSELMEIEPPSDLNKLSNSDLVTEAKRLANEFEDIVMVDPVPVMEYNMEDFYYSFKRAGGYMPLEVDGQVKLDTINKVSLADVRKGDKVGNGTQPKSWLWELTTKSGKVKKDKLAQVKRWSYHWNRNKGSKLKYEPYDALVVIPYIVSTYRRDVDDLLSKMDEYIGVIKSKTFKDSMDAYQARGDKNIDIDKSKIQFMNSTRIDRHKGNSRDDSTVKGSEYTTLSDIYSGVSNLNVAGSNRLPSVIAGKLSFTKKIVDDVRTLLMIIDKVNTTNKTLRMNYSKALEKEEKVVKEVKALTGALDKLGKTK